LLECSKATDENNRCLLEKPLTTSLYETKFIRIKLSSLGVQTCDSVISRQKQSNKGEY